MKKILIFLLAITLVSCDPCKHILKRADKKDCISYDTTMVVENHSLILYRDTTIYVEVPMDAIHDTVTLQVHNNIIMDVHKIFKSDYMTIDVNIKNNLITVDATINRKKFSVTIKDALVRIIKERHILRKVVITKNVNELTTWQRFILTLGYIFSAVFLLCLILFIINFKNKIF